MRVLITGAGGQLGRELTRRAPKSASILALTRRELDIRDREATEQAVAAHSPEVTVNGAAFTRVDRAEAERDAAFEVNAAGAENVARACLESGCRLIQISTDFVFDGRLGRPYRPGDSPNPLSVYGESKLAGERAVGQILGDRALVIRTAWLYSRFGRNFVKSILGQLEEGNEIRVAADQIGSPTWAGTLAEIVWRSVELHQLGGVIHAADAGVASWYDLAIAVQEIGGRIGLLDRKITIQPIRAEKYPKPAARPSLSALDCSTTWSNLDLAPRHWRRSLETMLEELMTGQHA